MPFTNGPTALDGSQESLLPPSLQQELSTHWIALKEAAETADKYWSCFAVHKGYLNEHQFPVLLEKATLLPDAQQRTAALVLRQNRHRTAFGIARIGLLMAIREMAEQHEQFNRTIVRLRRALHYVTDTNLAALVAAELVLHLQQAQLISDKFAGRIHSSGEDITQGAANRALRATFAEVKLSRKLGERGMNSLLSHELVAIPFPKHHRSHPAAALNDQLVKAFAQLQQASSFQRQNGSLLRGENGWHQMMGDYKCLRCNLDEASHAELMAQALSQGSGVGQLIAQQNQKRAKLFFLIGMISGRLELVREAAADVQATMKELLNLDWALNSSNPDSEDYEESFLASIVMANLVLLDNMLGAAKAMEEAWTSEMKSRKEELSALTSGLTAHLDHTLQSLAFAGL